MIAVLLSIYGAAPFLKEFLDSLKKQSFRDFRLIYRFDGDAPAEVSEAVADFPDSVELKDRRHFGVLGAYRILIEAATEYDYVMFADQDDVWHPDKIALTLKRMKDAELEFGREKPVLVHCDLRVVDETLNEIAPSMMAYQSLAPCCNTLKQLMIQNNVTGCTMMCNQSLIRLCNLPDEAICHDWYIALIASALGRIVFIGRALIDYRQHGANVYGAVQRKKLFAMLFQRSLLHERLVQTQQQARVFLRQFDGVLNDTQKKTLKAWSGNLDSPHYFARLFCVLKNGFHKHDWERTVGLWWAI